MGRRKGRKGSRGSKWNFDLTAGKLTLVCMNRWGILRGAGQVLQGDYVNGLNTMGQGSISGVVTDSVTASLGYRIKTLLAPKGVPLFKSRSGKIGL